MARVDLRKLKDDAAKAVRGGDPARALPLYLALEKHEPREGSWSQRVAETCRRLGRTQDEIAALGRAVDRHVASGFLLRAIAACRQILERDPGHRDTQQRLAALCAERGLPAAPRPEASAGAPALPRGAPLAEISLADVVAESRPIELAGVAPDASGSSVHEIPLDLTLPPVPAPDAADAAQLERLERTPLFSELSRSSLQRAIEGMRHIELAEGEELFHQGDAADALYVVAEGAVVPIAETAPRKRLAVLEEGAFFGEVGIVADHPRTATVEALVETRLLALDRTLVGELIEHEPRILRVLLRFLRDRLIDRLARTSPLFLPLDAAGRAQLAGRFRFLEAAAGAPLIAAGRKSDALFVLLAGEADVLRVDAGSSERVAALGVGDVVGEMSLLFDAPAMARVVATRRCWVLALPAAEVSALLARDPHVAGFLREVAEERRRRNDERRALPRDRHLDLV